MLDEARFVERAAERLDEPSLKPFVLLTALLFSLEIGGSRIKQHYCGVFRGWDSKLGKTLLLLGQPAFWMLKNLARCNVNRTNQQQSQSGYIVY